MTLADQYKSKFGTLPPKLVAISYNNEIYQNLMKEAIERNEPLTGDEILETFKDYKRDIVR